MIILNKTKPISSKESKSMNHSSVSIIDLNKHNSTNNYYESIWKSKYKISIYNKTPVFEKNLIKYLKGEKSYIE
jgi:hypothetical protein